MDRAGRPPGLEGEVGCGDTADAYAALKAAKALLPWTAR